jgi:succinate dehydrogenase flavin-adding protein (antitoxin of CptAB toxin-antitoxin module)
MLEPVELSRLKWRSRRGMLENDLVLQTFYARHERDLDLQCVAGLNALLDLPDGDLWDMIVGRADLAPGAPPEVTDMLSLLRLCEAALQTS